MSGLRQLLTRSLFARLLLVMLSGITLAQVITSLIWAGQLDSDSRQRVAKNAQYLTMSLSVTTRYFQALPDNVRLIVMDQQREVGGSRLFMSVNEFRISVTTQVSAPLKNTLLSSITNQLGDELGATRVELALAMPEHVRVYDQRVPLARQQARQVQPLAVVQVHLGDENRCRVRLQHQGLPNPAHRNFPGPG